MAACFNVKNVAQYHGGRCKQSRVPIAAGIEQKQVQIMASEEVSVSTDLLIAAKFSTKIAFRSRNSKKYRIFRSIRRT